MLFFLGVEGDLPGILDIIGDMDKKMEQETSASSAGVSLKQTNTKWKTVVLVFGTILLAAIVLFSFSTIISKIRSVCSG